MPAPLPADEQQRLRLLGELGILDTPAEPSFDTIAKLAVEASGFSSGALCFVDAERLWLKAAIGPQAQEMPRDEGFCAHTILGAGPLLVEDATLDPRFASIPLVTRAPSIRAYAAAPVVVEGHAVATVAVFDPRPRVRSGHLGAVLADLARLASDLLRARLAEQRARLQEARVRMASRASSDWLWESDADACITWMSDSADAHLGEDEVRAAIGRHWTDTYRPHPRSADSFERYQQARERREPFHDLIVERNAGDRPLVVRLGGVPVFDSAGTFRGYRGAACDVTAEFALRDEAEHSARELALSEERWKFALDVSSQGVWDWDIPAQHMYVSPGWRSLLGLEDDSPPVSPADWPTRIHLDDVEAAQARLFAHLRGETATYSSEYRMRHHDGRWLWVQNRGKVVRRDGAGRALRIIGTLVDVTERRAAEAAFRDKQAAELATQAKSRFLSRMSHEIRTPLNAVLGFTQLLQDDPVATDPARVQEYAMHSLRAGRHLLALVDDVLDLQRVDEDRLELRIEPVPLAPLVARAIETVRVDAEERGVHLFNEVAADAVVQADAERLLQAVANLSSNAVKYNRPAGRVRWLTKAADNGRAALIVDDSGAGMSEVQMARLFQPFERLGRETSTVDGTGLGLIIARSLVEKMGGRLNVTSRPGLGTRAAIELPLANGEPTQASTKVSSSRRYRATAGAGGPPVQAALRRRQPRQCASLRRGRSHARQRRPAHCRRRLRGGRNGERLASGPVGARFAPARHDRISGACVPARAAGAGAHARGDVLGRCDAGRLRTRARRGVRRLLDQADRHRPHHRRAEAVRRRGSMSPHAHLRSLLRSPGRASGPAAREHEQSTGLFVSALAPRGGPCSGPAEPDPRKTLAATAERGAEGSASCVAGGAIALCGTEMSFAAEPPFEHGKPERVAVVLVNLGTPDAPTPSAVRRYLREFLSDPRVVEIPRLAWWPILHGIILRTRPRASAQKYAAVWSDDGSPLAVWTVKQSKLLAGYLGERGHRVMVRHAMRYGRPSIAGVLDALKRAGATRILVLPAYPQYAAATTGSVFDAVAAWGRRQRNLPELRIVRGYHDDPKYIDALARRVQDHWQTHGRPDKLVMSFHGVPARSLQLGDPYHCECQKTARLLAERLSLKASDWQVTFQSRFGRAKWLEPYTEPTLRALAHGGCRHVDVICPGFSADCLETLEEIAMEARAVFLGAGGREFGYIPALNDYHPWIDALASIAMRHLQGWPTAAPADAAALEAQQRRAVEMGAVK